MKSPQYPQEESPASIVQRLLNKKKLTNQIFNSHNKTAEERRLNDFYSNEKEIKKGAKNG